MRSLDDRMGYKIYLGDFLKRLRAQRRLSQGELSDRTQSLVSPDEIARLEDGIQDRPPESVVDFLSGALEVDEKEAFVFDTLVRYRSIDSEVVDFYLSDPEVKVDDLGALIFLAEDDRNPRTKSRDDWWTALNAMKDMADRSYKDWLRTVAKKS